MNIGIPSENAEALVGAAELLTEFGDVLAERVGDGAPPGWAVRRGWDRFLLALSDEEISRCEIDGAPRVATLASVPDDLALLARGAAAVVSPLAAAPSTASPGALHAVSRRKSGQVTALVELCRELGLAPRRVVDVGSGAGHLTRALARSLAVEAVGLERDEGRVARARARAHPDDAGADASGAARFEAVEVSSAATLTLERGDLAVGLHACGALGDTLVEVAARDRADLVLVACCPQKVPAPRRVALSRTGREHGLSVEREVLGLANAFEGTPDLEARAVRTALRSLLRARGVHVRPGQETQGLTPRARGRLDVASRQALARLGLAPATGDEQRDALARARGEVELARRRTLPRRLLAAALEVALALDRACALEEAGARARVVRLFPRSMSPRNIAVVARGG